MCDIAADFIERRYPFSRDGASRGQDRLVLIVTRDVPIMHRYCCGQEGCNNHVVEGGVCIKGNGCTIQIEIVKGENTCGLDAYFQEWEGVETT